MFYGEQVILPEVVAPMLWLGVFILGLLFRNVCLTSMQCCFSYYLVLLLSKAAFE